MTKKSAALVIPLVSILLGFAWAPSSSSPRAATPPRCSSPSSGPDRLQREDGQHQSALYRRVHHPVHADHTHGALGGLRLPRGPLQHRRGGPVDGRVHGRHSRGPLGQGASGRPRGPRPPRCDGGGRVLGGDPRLPQGAVQRARGRHDHHDELRGPQPQQPAYPRRLRKLR